MDVVEPGRRWSHPFWYVALALALAGLTVAGPARARKQPAQVPPPTAVSYPTQTPWRPPDTAPGAVEIASDRPGRARVAPLRDYDRLDLLLVSRRGVRAPDAADWALAAPPGFWLASFLRLGDGFATVSEPDGPDDKKVHVAGVDRGTPWSLRLQGSYDLVPAARDDEFWTVRNFWDVAGSRAVAQRRDRRGRALGAPITLPPFAHLYRELADGRLLIKRDYPDDAHEVWDPATRRVTRTLPVGGIIAVGARHLAWQPHPCPRENCPVRVTDVVTGRTSAFPVPSEVGRRQGVVTLDPTGTRLAFRWGRYGQGDSTLYVAEAGARAATHVTGPVRHTTPFTWTSDGRLVAYVRPLGGARHLLVWDERHGLRRAPTGATPDRVRAIAAW